MRRKFRTTVLAIMTAGLASAGSAQAQLQQQAQQPAATDVQSIVAIVNDEIISAYDLNLRLSLIIAASGGVSSQEEYLRVREDVLDSMVDERLQIQEAREWEVNVTPDEVDEAIGNIARNNNMSREDFTRYLNSVGSDIDTLRPQILSSIAWQQLVQGRFGPQVNVSDAEIDSVMNRLMENAGEAEYLLSEIYLPTDNPRERQASQEVAPRISEQLRSGAPFESLARQFSDATSAAVGGDLGWVMADQVDPAIASALTDLEVGDISDPITTDDGIYILRLRDRRRILGADPMDEELSIKQVTLNASPDATAAELEALTERAKSLSAERNACTDLAGLAADLGTSEYGDVGTVRARDLPDRLRSQLMNLSVGQATEPFVSGNRMQMLVICDRVAPEVEPPSEAAIENSLVDQRLAMISRRYLRDLRQDAIIDYR